APTCLVGRCWHARCSRDVEKNPMTPVSIRYKQELYSIVQAIVGLAVLVLVLAGIGGTIYKVISPEGCPRAWRRSARLPWWAALPGSRAAGATSAAARWFPTS